MARVKSGENYPFLQKKNKWYKIKIDEETQVWVTFQYAIEYRNNQIIKYKNMKTQKQKNVQGFTQRHFFGVKSGAGFTLIEILLVIGIIAILAAVVIVAVNPARQFAQARNTQRLSNVNTILNAVYQYAVDNTGTLPSSIPMSADCFGVTTNEICKTGGTCTSLVDLSVLTTDEKYLVSMPYDPSGATTDGTGYHIAKSANGRITVCAPHAELDVTISVTR